MISWDRAKWCDMKSRLLSYSPSIHIISLLTWIFMEIQWLLNLRQATAIRSYFSDVENSFCAGSNPRPKDFKHFWVPFQPLSIIRDSVIQTHEIKSISVFQGALEFFKYRFSCLFIWLQFRANWNSHHPFSGAMLVFGWVPVNDFTISEMHSTELTIDLSRSL